MLTYGIMLFDVQSDPAGAILAFCTAHCAFSVCTNKVACAPSEDSDQPGHPPSLIRVFPVP